jgi:hypothetical protein
MPVMLAGVMPMAVPTRMMRVPVMVVTARLAPGMGAARAGDGDQAGDDRSEERQEDDG